LSSGSRFSGEYFSGRSRAKGARANTGSGRRARQAALAMIGERFDPYGDRLGLVVPGHLQVGFLTDVLPHSGAHGFGRALYLSQPGLSASPIPRFGSNLYGSNRRADSPHFRLGPHSLFLLQPATAPVSGQTDLQL